MAKVLSIFVQTLLTYALMSHMSSPLFSAHLKKNCDNVGKRLFADFLRLCVFL